MFISERSLLCAGRYSAINIGVINNLVRTMDGLREYLLSIGADAVGYADLSDVYAEHRMNLPYGVAIGIAANPEIVRRIPTDTVIREYSDEYLGKNSVLDKICVLAGEYINGAGYRAVPQTAGFVYGQRVKSKTGENLDSNLGRAPLPHKTVAALAGMGWISKSSLLVTKEFGSAVRITSVLTDMPLDANSADYSCRCGDCGICADACPGNAIKNVKWTPRTDRDELIDFDACRAVTLSRGEKYGLKYGTCGICVAVCPHTKKALG